MSNEELLSAVQTVVETAIQPLKEAMALQDEKINRLESKIDLVYEKLDDKTNLVFEAVKDVSRDLKDVKKTVKNLDGKQQDTEVRAVRASADATHALARTYDFEARLNVYGETLEDLKRRMPPAP